LILYSGSLLCFVDCCEHNTSWTESRMEQKTYRKVGQGEGRCAEGCVGGYVCSGLRVGVHLEYFGALWFQMGEDGFRLP